ncbi:hypothetical protein SALBM311S_00449 [Streptomyces alboniger]
MSSNSRLRTFGSKTAGPGHPVYVVGEIGINHNGELENAFKLIDAAADAGCDAVKFQKRTPEICTPRDQWDIERDTPWGRMTYIDYRHRVGSARTSTARSTSTPRARTSPGSPPRGTTQARDPATVPAVPPQPLLRRRSSRACAAALLPGLRRRAAPGPAPPRCTLACAAAPPAPTPASSPGGRHAAGSRPPQAHAAPGPSGAGRPW